MHLYWTSIEFKNIKKFWKELMVKQFFVWTTKWNVKNGYYNMGFALYPNIMKFMKTGLVLHL